jgi:hypothetical protein
MFMLIVKRFSTKEQTPLSKPNHQNPNDEVETSSLLVAISQEKTLTFFHISTIELVNMLSSK